MSKLRIASEMFEFMASNKKLWLAPVIIVLLLIGSLLVLTQGSALAPFIYSLF
jgi:hypothetical protein